jgi:putative transcriptional regulator
MAEFKIKLKDLLEKKELNQRYLVLKTGIRSGTINAYYHGFVKRMNVKDLIKICDALDCRLDELLEYIPDK